MKQNKSTIKTYFETGDKPTQEEYANLIDSYVDSQQEAGEANRRFVINADGEVEVSSEQKVPEYTLSDISNNKLSFLKDGVAIKEIDLSNYIDDTNLSRLVSGTVDVNGVATFFRDDNSIFTVDFSGLIQPTDIPEIQAGKNVTIDKTDPLNPIINSSGEIEGIKSTGLLANTTNEVVIGNEPLGGYASFSYRKGNILWGENKFHDGYDIVDSDLEPNKYSVFFSRTPNPSIKHIANQVNNILYRKAGVQEGRYAFEYDFSEGFKIRKELKSFTDYLDGIVKLDKLTQSREYQLPDKPITFAGVDDIPKIQAGENVTIDNTDPLNPIVNVSTVTPGLQSVLDNSNESTKGFILNNPIEKARLENTPNSISIGKTSEKSVPSRDLLVESETVTQFEGSFLTKDSLAFINSHDDLFNSPLRSEFSLASGLVIQSLQMAGLTETRINSIMEISRGGISLASLSESGLRIGASSGSRSLVDRNSLTFFNGTGNSFQIMPPQSDWNSSFQARFQSKNHTIAGLDDIPKIQAGTNITIDNTDPLNPIVNAVNSGSANAVTTDTNQTITGEKTITSNLFTSYVQSDNSINAARNITAGGRIRTGGNALDFTESGNAGSATIEANISGSTVHTLQPKSGVIAHLDDIVGAQKATITVSGSQLNFDGTKASNVILVPAQAGKIILVKSIVIERLLTKPVEQNYASAYVGYSLNASGYPLNLASINLSETNDLISYESNIQFSQTGNNFDEQPIGVPLVLKGEDGTGMTGAEGNIHITVEYEYYTTFKKNVS